MFNLRKALKSTKARFLTCLLPPLDTRGNALQKVVRVRRTLSGSRFDRGKTWPEPLYPYSALAKNQGLS